MKEDKNEAVKRPQLTEAELKQKEVEERCEAARQQHKELNNASDTEPEVSPEDRTLGIP